jgi:hypothetical protein
MLRRMPSNMEVCAKSLAIAAVWGFGCYFGGVNETARMAALAASPGSMSSETCMPWGWMTLATMLISGC